MTLTDPAERLSATLGVEFDETLTACIENANDELCLYLGWTETEWEAAPDSFARKAIQLAALYYRRETAEQTAGGVAKLSTTEEKLSQTVEYTAAGDWQSMQGQILNSLARYRKVGTRNVAVSET